eukprot:4931446-Amphidinium_carterae.1
MTEPNTSAAQGPTDSQAELGNNRADVFTKRLPNHRVFMGRGGSRAFPHCLLAYISTSSLHCVISG